MKKMAVIFSVLFCCCVLLIFSFARLAFTPESKTPAHLLANAHAAPHTVGEISLPANYQRLQPADSFATWLRRLQLRKDNTVYLYNGKPKSTQGDQYAVLDLSTGNKDLQQCADAIMRLRAEYFFARREYGAIDFRSTNKRYNFQEYLSRQQDAATDKHRLLLRFLETVFINCGTYTIEGMTKNIPVADVQPGDVFIKAGAPGHAMLVLDVAVHESGTTRIFLLAQSFMPAQDMHIVVNPASAELSPWYIAADEATIITPGWVFDRNNLKRF